jgi:anti-sigma B factor antagonist
MGDDTPDFSGITAPDDPRPVSRCGGVTSHEETADLLQILVTQDDSGPVVALCGEADVTTLAQLNSVLSAQVRASPRYLAVDLSLLRFADSATITALALAARTLRGQGGQLELRRPMPAIARVLQLTGVDQVVTVRGDAAG